MNLSLRAAAVAAIIVLLPSVASAENPEPTKRSMLALSRFLENGGDFAFVIRQPAFEAAQQLVGEAAGSTELPFPIDGIEVAVMVANVADVQGMAGGLALGQTTAKSNASEFETPAGYVRFTQPTSWEQLQAYAESAAKDESVTFEIKNLGGLEYVTNGTDSALRLDERTFVFSSESQLKASLRRRAAKPGLWFHDLHEEELKGDVLFVFQNSAVASVAPSTDPISVAASKAKHNVIAVNVAGADLVKTSTWFGNAGDASTFLQVLTKAHVEAKPMVADAAESMGMFMGPEAAKLFKHAVPVFDSIRIAQEQQQVTITIPRPAALDEIVDGFAGLAKSQMQSQFGASQFEEQTHNVTLEPTDEVESASFDATSKALAE